MKYHQVFPRRSEIFFFNQIIFLSNNNHTFGKKDMGATKI